MPWNISRSLHTQSDNLKILVTGAAGFIGFHLTKSLLDDGHQVVGLDNINDYYDVQLKLDRLKELGVNEINNAGELTISKKHATFQFLKADLNESERLNSLFTEEKFDAVCNLAAQVGVRYSVTNPEAYMKSNVQGFFNILEQCRIHKIGHLVYASSSSVYGKNKTLPFSTEDKVDQPISFYAATKKSNELFAHTYSHLFDLPTTGLRFFTVYGPWGRPDMAPFIFTKKIMDGDEITVFNDGDLKRDFTYVEDIVDGIKLIIAKPPIKIASASTNPIDAQPPYKVYNIGNGSGVQIMNFVETIEKYANKKAQINFKPLQAGDLVETLADTRALQADFSFKPKRDVDYGLEQFVSWYQSYYQD